jgi:hypothetical protein
MVYTRLEALGVGVLSLVSDRAKAWIKLAEKGLECLSIPEVGGVLNVEISHSCRLATPCFTRGKSSGLSRHLHF